MYRAHPLKRMKDNGSKRKDVKSHKSMQMSFFFFGFSRLYILSASVCENRVGNRRPEDGGRVREISSFSYEAWK